MQAPPRTMAALITPFNNAGSIDVGAHRHNLGVLTDRGLEGFLIAGSSGRRAASLHFPWTERKRVMAKSGPLH